MIRYTMLLALVAGALVRLSESPSRGHAEYQRVFQEQYVKAPDVDKAYRALVRKAKCYVCHQGKDRKNYNRYGLALTAHLKEGDKKDKPKTLAALAAVATEMSDGEGSRSFGDLIAGGDLPGGPLEESKKEPGGG